MTTTKLLELATEMEAHAEVRCGCDGKELRAFATRVRAAAYPSRCACGHAHGAGTDGEDCGCAEPDCRCRSFASPSEETGAPAYDMSIHDNPDARAWARFFAEHFPAGSSCPDEGTMIGWFANAMMAMHDHIKRAAPSSSPGTREQALEEAEKVIQSFRASCGCGDCDEFRDELTSRIRALAPSPRSPEALGTCRGLAGTEPHTLRQCNNQGTWIESPRETVFDIPAPVTQGEIPPAAPVCPECGGSGMEGTGTPSGEGGEDFRACWLCDGSTAQREAPAAPSLDDEKDGAVKRPEPVDCPSCGAPAYVDAGFCGDCGHRGPVSAARNNGRSK